MTLPEELSKKIQTYCIKHQLVLDFDYRDELSKDQIIKILESEDGLNDVENDIWENNLDYLNEHEDYFLENNLYDYFKNELTELFEAENPEENEDWIESEVKQFLREEFRDYCSTSLNFNQLLNNTGNLFCLIKVYSNYDCCNSFDKYEDEGYIYHVYQRVKHGVKHKDYMNEFYDGAYGGSLFCFAFQTDLKTLIEYKRLIRSKETKRILIPKGTQFGFFSSMNGAGSMFEMKTYRNFYLNIQEEGGEYYPEYDHVEIIADIEQHYNMDQVYGCTSKFLDEQKLVIK